MFKKTGLIVLVLSLVFVLGIDFSANYKISNTQITISVNGNNYANDVEFYKGKYEGGTDPAEKFIGSKSFFCDSGSCDFSFLFDQIDINSPGDYYFVIWDNQRKEAQRVDFNLNEANLLGCNYNGQFIANNDCVSENNDNPSLCRNQQLINACGACGCPGNKICRAETGECIDQEQKTVEEPLSPTKPLPQTEIVQDLVNMGCTFSGYDSLIPDGICVNEFFPEILSEFNNPLFASSCECTIVQVEDPDKDGDGYDSLQFEGSDCNDLDVNINPGIIESCQAELGNNGIDEDCSGKDTDCSFACDSDKDGYWDMNKGFCSSVAKLIGKNLEQNDNSAVTYPGAPEICDGIDNNEEGVIDEGVTSCLCSAVSAEFISEIKSSSEICNNNADDNCNGQIDELSQCKQCKNGESQLIPGLCQDGRKMCNNGQWQETIKSVNECSPSLTVSGYNGLNLELETAKDQEIVIKSVFTCKEDSCNDLVARLYA